MIDKDKTILYLSSSIAALLIASRLSALSLKRSIVVMFAVLNVEILFGILAVMHGRTALTVAILVIAASTLLLAVLYLSNLFRIKRDLQRALSLWSKELGDLSGDLVGGYEAGGDDQEKIKQRVRVIQRFLDLLN